MDIITLKEAKARRLKFYFTGHPCKYGHISKRYTSVRQCVECKDIHYNQNREEILAKCKITGKKYREENRENVK